MTEEYLLKQQKLISAIALELSSSADFDRVLKLLGEHTGVSRVYIFEDSDDGLLTTNTYEWVADGIDPQKENLQNFPYTEIPSWKKYLDEDGELRSDNVDTLPEDIKGVLKSQSITAVLVFPLKAKGESFGFVGLDETKGPREWVESEYELLRTISVLIGNAYEKAVYEKELKRRAEEAEKVNELMVSRELKMAEMKKKLSA